MYHCYQNHVLGNRQRYAANDLSQAGCFAAMDEPVIHESWVNIMRHG